MTEIEYNKYLPPYRLLLTPNATYDYRTHQVVPLSQQDLKKIISRFHVKQTPPSLKMKYKSLLTDVLRKALILSMKMLLFLLQYVFQKRPRTFLLLPLEIQIYVLELVDDPDAYYSCVLTSKHMYQLAKPFLYKKANFTLSYRFAQFVTCLRVNLSVGMYVEELDLSQLKPGNWEWELSREDDDDDVFPNPAMIMAGWRDWKFTNNPLYSLHPAPAAPLTLVASNSSTNSLQHQKKKFRYFKRHRHSHVTSVVTPTVKVPAALGHPRINKFLMNYLGSKDVPMGYLLHVINLCPNLESINLGGLSMLSDYRIVQPMAHKYQLFDLMHNFHKDLVRVLDNINPTQQILFDEPKRKDYDLASSASSVFSITTFLKPIRKYNSLLPPLPTLVADLLYLSKGDGRVYLSDLNLKSINNAHLEVVNENEVFRCLGERSEKLRYVNLSSIISVNMKLVRDLLTKMLWADLGHRMIDDKEYLLFCGRYFEVGDNEVHGGHVQTSGLRILDVSDSGMYKNLNWAKCIDTSTLEGQQLIHRILNDEVVNSFEEYVIRERIRRGRIGENYFA